MALEADSYLFLPNDIGIWGVYFGSANEVQWRRGTLVGRLTESKDYKFYV